MNTNRLIAVVAVAGVLLVVGVGVVGHELGLRGVAAFALPLFVGVLVGVGTVGIGIAGDG